ncbi:hypothetical protein FI667_g10860, partial [Globisporangium splendens]
MSDDRVLAHATIVDALHEDDIAEILSDVALLSEQYLSTLQFLVRPDNLVGLIKCMLQAPAPTSETTPRSAERSAPGSGEFPCHEYAIVYRAHWVLCVSGFSSQLIAAIMGLQTEWRTAICVEITACNSRDTMTVEALARLLNTFMDQYSPESLLAFVGAEHQHAFLKTLLVLIYYEPGANILHCTISRLFIVALEDSPFICGKELPAFRAANDPLRLHLLLHGCFETVLSAFGSKEKRVKPPPAILDIAISFDQAVTTAQAHSPHLFHKVKDTVDTWREFRSSVLLPTQTLWEEQYEPPAPPERPKHASIAEFLVPASGLTLPALARHRRGDGTPMPGGMPSADLESEKKKFDGDEIPTPLSALYNDEERFLMLRMASTSFSAPSSPVPSVSSSSPLST